MKKKGCVIKSTDPCARKKIDSLNVDWYYTWGPRGVDGVRVPFVPMVWGASKIPDIDGPILCFNEPDRPDQSNIPVETALWLWPESSPRARLGSPATASNPIKPGWFTEFMKGGPKVDFICVHWYGPPRISSLLNIVDGLYDRYTLPIWITEFAVAQWNTTKPPYTEEQVLEFMDEILPELESRAHVERYAWKTRLPSDPYMGSSALFTEDGALTRLGEKYALK